MENKHFPEWEDSQLPEELVPMEMEALEPAIEDLTFAPEAAQETENPEQAFAPMAEQMPAEEELPPLPEPDLKEEPEDIRPIPQLDVPPMGPPPAPAEEEYSVIEELSILEEPLPEAEEMPVIEALPMEEAPSETPAAAEEEASVPKLEEPQDSHEIQAHKESMDAHGMLDHGEAEPPFDLSILDDPELALPEEKPEEKPQDDAYQGSQQEFDSIYQPAETEKKTAPIQPIPRKGRPKRKKGEGLLGIPNILVTVVWLALIVAIGVTAGRMLWVCAADVLAFGREDKPVTITIYEADTMEDIIDKLHEGGLIRYKSLFTLYANISDAEEDIRPGIYDLNTRYDYHALVNFMSPRSSREVIEITIPEGYTNRQIFALLEENRICTAVDLEVYAAEGELNDYWFLENLERGTVNRLEGYLFPDTYEFYKNSTPAEAIHKMLDNFNTRFTEEMRGQIDLLNANVTGGGYTVREIVIVASLIEKESAAPSESPSIAGVIYNRLFRWEFPALLNIDAAIVYAQGGNAENIDTRLDSPYNTYTHVGLTPTAIANPGLSSLQAALNPAVHDYYYYVLNPNTGMHQFSTTQAEHDAWIAEFYG